jgi:O-antigen/teichoic acid export membrane protein
MKRRVNRSARAFDGLLANAVQIGLTMGLQIALTPIILKNAGQEVLGAYSFLMQAVSWAALTDLGFGVATGRNLAQAYGAGDNHMLFGRVFTIGRTFQATTNLVLAGGILLIGFYANALVQMTPEVAEGARLGLTILAVWVALRAPLILFSDALIATQNLAAANVIAAGGAVVRMGSSVLFVLGGCGLVGLMVAQVLGECVSLAAARGLFAKRFPDVQYGWGIPDKMLFRSMLAFGLTYMVMIVAGRLGANTDSIIVGTLQGAAAVSIYYTTQMPAMIAWQMIWRIVDNSSPGMNELYAKGDRAAFASAYLRILRLSLAFGIILAFGVIAFNRWAIEIWVGPAQFAGQIFTVCLAIFGVTQIVNHVNAVILTIIGRIQGMVVFSVGAGVVKVLLAIILGHSFGIKGVMAASALADLPCLWYFTRCMLKLTPNIRGRVMDETIIPTLRAACGPAAAFLIVIISNANHSSWMSPVSLVFFSITSGVSIWFFGLTKTDRDLVKNLVNRPAETATA